jgi:hypothetical protein
MVPTYLREQEAKNKLKSPAKADPNVETTASHDPDLATIIKLLNQTHITKKKSEPQSEPTTQTDSLDQIVIEPSDLEPVPEVKLVSDDPVTEDTKA